MIFVFAIRNREQRLLPSIYGEVKNTANNFGKCDLYSSYSARYYVFAQTLFFSQKKKRINKIAFGLVVDLSVIRRGFNYLNKLWSEAIFPTLTQTASRYRPEKLMQFRCFAVVSLFSSPEYETKLRRRFFQFSKSKIMPDNIIFSSLAKLILFQLCRNIFQEKNRFIF